MSHNKVHNSQGNVPFSWENKPGESKIITTPEDCPPTAAIGNFPEKLPPPPCPPDMSCTASRASFHDLQLPLPPCPFQQPERSSSRRGLIARRNDDPFLTAYRECTKNNHNSSRKGDVGFGFKIKSMSSIFSCKQSCSVVDDSMRRTSKLPKSKSERESSITPKYEM